MIIFHVNNDDSSSSGPKTQTPPAPLPNEETKSLG